MSTYELIHAAGSDLGRQHGEQVRERLLGFVDYLGRTLRLSTQGLGERARRFLPLFERHCPHLVDEIRGLAAGARVPFEWALAVQIRGELAAAESAACTTFVLAPNLTASGEILIGQNSDMEPEMEEFAYVLHLEPADRPAVLMWTFGGQIGYHGLNAVGVAHFANALGGGPRWKFGLPHYPVKRMMLECRSLDELLALVRRAPVCSNGNYVLCDGAGQIADIESTPDGFERLDDHGAGFIVHTNHYLCGGHACRENYDLSLADSFSRLDRIRRLVAAKAGSITVADMKQCLADHDGHPASICRHPGPGPDHPSISARGKTVASLIAEPQSGRLHVARGNPCAVEHGVFEL